MVDGGRRGKDDRKQNTYIGPVDMGGSKWQGFSLFKMFQNYDHEGRGARGGGGCIG